MARRVVEEGFPLTIWARRRASLEPFADTAAVVAETPRGLGAASDIVGVCVVADADVEQVVLGPDGVLAGMSAGGVVVIHSTVHPDTCAGIARAAAERGVSVVDAPVSGGGHTAAARQLLVMVGGDPEVVERCRPVLDTFGNPVVHLGPLGSGQMAKLINNLVFTAQITIGLETYAFADQLGVDRAALAEVLASGSGGSRVAGILAASGFDTTGLRTHALPLLDKDTRLILDVARSKTAPPPEHVAALARHTLKMLADMDGSSPLTKGDQ
jgi:3-hydroxyisobutyrate dehydrogenase-like beta-hydroxyacid dehydrogenase